MKSSAAAIAAQAVELAALNDKKRTVGLLDAEHRRREKLMALAAGRRRYLDRKIETARLRAEALAANAAAAQLEAERQAALTEQARKRASACAFRARRAFRRYQEVRAAA